MLDRSYRRDVVTIPIVWLTFALSLLLHVAALWLLLPRLRMLSPQPEPRAEVSDRLTVQLTPRPPSARPGPPPTPAPTVPPARPPVPTPPRVIPTPSRPVVRMPAPRPRPQLAVPAPAAPAPAPIPEPAPPPPPPVAQRTPPAPPVQDLSAYIEARRRERGEDSTGAGVTPGESDTERVNRMFAGNLPTPAKGVAGEEPRRGGGIFEIKRLDYDDAAFAFFGWNKEMGRRTPQLIEVRKGNNSDMRIAVIRRMIAIIRMYEHEDFVWESQRLEKKVILSAREEDTAKLEAFMLKEFFDNGNPR